MLRLKVDLRIRQGHLVVQDLWVPWYLCILALLLWGLEKENTTDVNQEEID